ncbi:deoxyribose-phosphate aldolase [Flagellimonas allohymeniacidonis]|uniref:Deoxyribose-phosphate aldolase n=1 Tax=Flagellimonas allohymeniacidonis TaxID=2517819 RepID=A0A4Q8QGQ4_9FLAO|nr:deoxyribose-phosphate aldolase [Allomuricauda hymeniacidonis]TAI48418.1 deoxyribose-phosphate aldolase [Allomuricauda hymeniacidonis]
MTQLEKYIDHTLLKPTATIADIKKLCHEAKEHRFKAVCVQGCHLELAKEELGGGSTLLATVLGFPLGGMSTKAKIGEAKDYIEKGADELDMVLNIGWLKSGLDSLVQEEIRQIKQITGDKILKVILETCFLTDDEKKKASHLAVEAGADFIKTSTGFGSGGATFEDVRLIKSVVGDNALIKASGGIKDRPTAVKYIEMGVSRIGTSSGPQLIKTS